MADMGPLCRTVTQQHVFSVLFLAGEKVFLSQSATSGALARLREYFDDQILVQIGRKMVLTPLGESLILPVRELLMKVQATLESRPDLDIAQTERRLAELWAQYLPIKILAAAAELPIPPFSWSLQWHQIQDLDPVNRWMRELMLDVARNLPAPRSRREPTLDI